MKLRHTQDQPSDAREGASVYVPRHLREDVPVETAPETAPTGGSHAHRRSLGVLGRIARMDVHPA